MEWIKTRIGALEAKTSGGNSVVVGLDPGKEGGAGVIDLHTGQVLDCFLFPLRPDEKALDYRALHRWGRDVILMLKVEAVGIEIVGARPQEGPVGAFTFGTNNGALNMLAASLEDGGAAIVPVAPERWQKRFFNGMPGGEQAKTSARVAAGNLWPKAADFSIKKSSGIADGLLIAEYTRQWLRRSLPAGS